MPLTLLSPGDAARRLELSTSRLVQLDREGVFLALRDSSGRRLYDPDAVERFAELRRARLADRGNEAACA